MTKAKRKLTLGQLAARVAALAPPSLAEPWDNVGLQVGEPGAEVRRVMTCLEVTAPTIAEAKRRKADAIVSHHPLIFRPMKSLIASEPVGALVTELVRSGIGLVAAHTNLDSAVWGTNQVLAERCGFKIGAPLEPKTMPAPYKFVVFTPKGYEQKVIDAIARGGGGMIGAYTHCSFRAPGIGTFKGGDATNPFIGEKGKFEEVEEFRLEALVPREAHRAVLFEVLKIHPYEEPAYEFVLLAEDSANIGLGGIAKLEKPMKADSLAREIKKKLKLKQVRLSGPTDIEVRKLAICTGSGGSLITRAASAGTQALLTGEAKYHDGIEAHQRGVALMEIGHFESEQIVVEPLARRLSGDPGTRNSGVVFFAAMDDLQPFSIL